MQNSLVFNRSDLNPVMLNVRSNRMQALFVALFRSKRTKPNQTKPIEPISNWFALPHKQNDERVIYTQNQPYSDRFVRLVHKWRHVWQIASVSFTIPGCIVEHHSVAEYGFKCYESIFMLVIHALAIIAHNTRITLSRWFFFYKSFSVRFWCALLTNLDYEYNKSVRSISAKNCVHAKHGISFHLFVVSTASWQ